MFGKTVVRDMIERSAENETDRRLFLKSAGVAGLGAVGGAALAGVGVDPASAAAPSDGAVLNFALNLEYLEAEFYSHAAFGHGLAAKLTSGKGRHGGVVGGRKVDFSTPKIAKIAREIAHDEVAHVKFLRAALGGAKVARPQIDLKHSFTAAAQAAGLIGKNQTFDPFANENNFLLAAFIFEDVGVTAYKGAAPLISNKTYLDAAAGILSVEAYHAGIVRSKVSDKGLWQEAKKISDARDSLDGRGSDDQGVGRAKLNLVPADENAIAFGRPAAKVLNVVYLNPKRVDHGGFYPRGVNGTIRTSAATKS
ncbi:ferritin-like domain-containing protein [Nocardioides mangrovi]|uniref:Ferritin-like domain-containing protein n=1 Tax=Nocardioides mangrovi TaxID=2874580 RepID=A0ABS7UIT1_9ACTN|nr:ferritin-like domain-containing protein [Nocardioides mangrovi]MBZ5740715.1 ferritin-like domain-containing protein [Nocardioides mangrovi]